VIDIEKPSPVSSQHIYLLKYQLKPENKVTEGSDIQIKFSLKYPIHFRYRKPHYEFKYKSAYVNRKPEFYFDCLNLKYYSNTSIEIPNDLLINGEFSKVMTRVNSTHVSSDDLLVLVPNGDLNDLPLIIMITLFVTVGSALYIAMKMSVGSNKKLNMNDQIR